MHKHEQKQPGLKLKAAVLLRKTTSQIRAAVLSRAVMQQQTADLLGFGYYLPAIYCWRIIT